MTEESKKEKLTGPELFRRALAKRGIKVQKVDPPKDFCRVIIPGIPWGPLDDFPPDKEKPDEAQH